MPIPLLRRILLNYIRLTGFLCFIQVIEWIHFQSLEYLL
ncbi:hypothetical protein M2E15_2201 [Bacillus mycoides]|nr:hypothetical protein bmyco0001_17080 [Bacillus mycoides DSM 2048]KUH42109.1 hypothetical protein M2E15_2201 [Bacillus mycoides]OSY07490.1 hypothetical protein S2E19_05201 [Bacillus mycoides]OSY17012.1 hypothetical protein BTJ48_00823 [Bacillus mycoides]